MVEEGRCWIEDLGSAGGTTVDGQEIRDQDCVELKPGVLVKIGAAEIRLNSSPAPKRTRALVAEVHCLPSFNYSLAHTDVPFLQSLTLKNEGPETLSDLDVQVSVIPYAESERISIKSLSAGGTSNLGAIRVFYDSQRLIHLVELLPCPCSCRSMLGRRRS